MADAFEAPDFILNAEADTIQARMMENLPPDIDDMPGGFPWDFTMPTALVLSEFVQSRLARAVKLMFPQYAWGEWLDKHGEREGVIRKAARAAAGILHITSQIGTLLPAGTAFCTPSAGGNGSIVFTTDEDVLIENGEADVAVTAAVAGQSGNVMAGAVSMAMRPVPGVTEITNREALTGGADEESDEAYRERILEVCRADISFVGAPSDYVRWAKAVPGVGSATCIPEWDGPGTVKVIAYDDDGGPAASSVITEVYKYIMGTAPNSSDRLAPIGATLTVIAPTAVSVSISCFVKLEATATMESVQAAVQEALKEVFTTAPSDGELKWADVFAIITQADGVYDAKDLLLNDGTANVAIRRDQYLDVGAISLTQY